MLYIHLNIPHIAGRSSKRTQHRSPFAGAEMVAMVAVVTVVVAVDGVVTAVAPPIGVVTARQYEAWRLLSSWEAGVGNEER